MTQPAPSTLPWGTCLATLPNAQGAIDLTPSMLTATGRDVLSQSLIRRQTTPRGSVLTSPNDCIDIRQLLSAGVTLSQLQALAGTIRTELLRDQRVIAADVRVTYNSITNVTTIAESIQSALGPFTLTLALTAGSISVIVAGQ